MAYLGRGIENLSDRVVLDSLTASATASYTLQLNSVNFVPSSAESLTVSLNGVIQAPISSYTVSGSTLTFASALTSSDSIDFIIAERGITLQTPSAGSVGTSQLASTAVTTAKIADDAVTKDKVLNLMYPAFEAYQTTTQALTTLTITKAQLGTERFDTDNCYDNSTNYRFTPTVAGKYMFGANVYMDATNTIESSSLAFYKNGSRLLYKEEGLNNVNNQQLTGVITLDTDDYVELYMKVDVASGGTFQVNMDGTTSDNRTYWYGYKLIGV